MPHERKKGALIISELPANILSGKSLCADAPSTSEITIKVRFIFGGKTMKNAC